MGIKIHPGGLTGDGPVIRGWYNPDTVTVSDREAEGFLPFVWNCKPVTGKLNKQIVSLRDDLEPGEMADQTLLLATASVEGFEDDQGNAFTELTEDRLAGIPAKILQYVGIKLRQLVALTATEAAFFVLPPAGDLKGTTSGSGGE